MRHKPAGLPPAGRAIGSRALTVREIGAAVGLSSSSSVLYQLRRLEQTGALARDRYRPTSVRMS
ncbi:LexA family protein [Streptomyces sp. NPDC001970]